MSLSRSHKEVHLKLCVVKRTPSCTAWGKTGSISSDWVEKNACFSEKCFVQNCIFFRFHVDKLSSAHVYLRLKEGETLDDIPANVLEDAAQLVKANSIQVHKLNI